MSCRSAPSRRPAPARIALASLAGIAATGTGLLLYALAEAQWFALRRLELNLAASGADGASRSIGGEAGLVGDSASDATKRRVRVLHLSDFHMAGGALGRRKAAWVRRLAALEPDLVVVTGDIIAAPAGLEPALWALEAFAGVPGAFVFGSNDYFRAHWGNPARYLREKLDPLALERRVARLAEMDVETQSDLPWRELRDSLEGFGWFDLNNAARAVEAGGATVRLLGLGDPHIGLDDPGAWAGSGAAGPGGAAGDLVIGVVHAPYARSVAALASAGAELVLAGHTHGGQIALPGRGALVSNCDLPPALARGLHRWCPPRAQTGISCPMTTAAQSPPVWLHVSAGLGTSPFAPIRLACRPEASLIEISF